MTGPLAPERLMARIEALRAISETEDAYTRRYLTPEHRRAADLVSGWMREAGLTVREDAVGNVIGRLEGADPDAPALMLGSHLDTVRDAGAFDGMLGVVSAIEVAESLAGRGRAPAFPVEVVAFGDEEGLRFRSMLLTSRALAGTLAPEELAIVGEDGMSVAEAMRAYGLDPARLAEAAYAEGALRGWLELHIEQGPVLEAERLPVGVVTAIAGQSQFEARFAGTAGHAGTIPMGRRRDALAAAAEGVLAIERAPDGLDGAVATVGRIAVSPGATNVVPGEAVFTIDVRGPSDEIRDQVIGRIEGALAGIAARRGVDHVLKRLSKVPATPCDPGLRAALDGAARAVTGASRDLMSGAGHDAIALAALCPVGMLFVRCRGGVSHNPAEWCEPADMAVATTVLLRTVEALGA